MRETSGEKEFERFHAIVYSVDVFVPLVDLHQGKYWLPDANKRIDKTENVVNRFFMGGGFLWWYLRFHIVAGWVLSTLLVVGLTGLVRQRR